MPRIQAGLATILSSTQAVRDQTARLTLTTEAERTAMATMGTQLAQLAQQQYQAALAGQTTVRKLATDADKAATRELRGNHET